MIFENTQVFGLENAIIGMRLPMAKDFADAKEKCDSVFTISPEGIGEKDNAIMKKLIGADKDGGQPNSKFLRMIHAQVAITAPLYWWKQADTYKIGTTTNSTSTMHTLANFPITRQCFEHGEMIPDSVILYLEGLRKEYAKTKDKETWQRLIVNLPESWMQTRMLDCDYQTLRNIYHWRKNHKLTEWRTFCDWIEGLPLSWLLTRAEDN